MKQIFFISLLTFYFITIIAETFAQTAMDSLLASKVTVSGFCLCKTTLDDLQRLDSDFKLIDVEEMDMGKNCMGGDARFENGKGYYSEMYPGMIFQKDPEGNYISKIRLTKGFVGKLPGGTSIDLNHLLLKDIINDYPEEYKNKLTDLKKESNVTYILNNKVIRTNFEADLFQINDSNFVSLEVISGQQVKSDYHIRGKSFGIVITTK